MVQIFDRGMRHLESDLLIYPIVIKILIGWANQDVTSWIECGERRAVNAATCLRQVSRRCGRHLDASQRARHMMKPWMETYIADMTRRYGELPPPWVIYDEHPYSICWRMGGGEAHVMAWGPWWAAQALTEEARVAYFRRWPPPHCWLAWVLRALWRLPDGAAERDRSLAFAKLEALGFGGAADYLRDLDDPKWLDDVEDGAAGVKDR
jgi:hypothetical protein